MSQASQNTNEKELAIEQNKKQQGRLIASRTWNMSLSVLFLLLFGAIAYTGFWMFALIALILGLIFLSQYFDANGHLHEVQRRSTKTLVRDFSVLKREESQAPHPTSS
ncbi:MAG: hypothetical protein MI725_14220 [Pirellulales bacterium]|nr:hypothetical protein [Pirellulales bacterium]